VRHVAGSAFGRVVKGWTWSGRYQKAPADGQALTPPVRITKASRLP
jgi:hypothetical protein